MSPAGGEGRLSRILSRVLAGGLAVAIVLMLAGAVLAALGTGAPLARKSSLSDLLGALAGLEPGGFFDLGLLVLVAIPIARVVVLLVGFARCKVWLFSVVSLAVLAILGLGAFLGLRAG